MLTSLCAWAWLAAVAPFCPPPSATIAYSGYIEGEYVSPAPDQPGRITSVAVARGQRIAAGDELYRIDDTAARKAVAAARASLAAAEAELADLTSGKRPEEIAVTAARLDEVQATYRQAAREHERQSELFQKNIVSQAAYDRSRAALDQARAQAESLKKQIEVDVLPARAMAVEAARNRVVAERAAVEEAEWRLSQRTVTAAAAGTVDIVLRRPGENSGPDRPAVRLLPDGNRVVRYFVPQADRAGIRVGARIALSCDGCAAGLTGVVSFVANEPEFNPPVIYSVESRAKLVYLVEARPAGAAATLLPGQPVDVVPLQEQRP